MKKMFAEVHCVKYRILYTGRTLYRSVRIFYSISWKKFTVHNQKHNLWVSKWMCKMHNFIKLLWSLISNSVSAESKYFFPEKGKWWMKMITVKTSSAQPEICLCWQGISPGQATDKLQAYSHGRNHLLNLNSKVLDTCICILSKIKIFGKNCWTKLEPQIKIMCIDNWML